MSRHSNKPIGDSKILQRKIPSTGRYNDVQPRVDTGSSVSRHLKRIEDMQTNYRYRNNELFRRMKATTLAQLMLQVANISMQDDLSVAELPSARGLSTTTTSLNGGDTNREELLNFDEATYRNEAGDVDQLSPRSSLQSVIRGVGEVDLLDRKRNAIQPPATPLLEKPYENCPYLLLDVRDSDEYNACHITGAKNFPIAMLSRTMNNFTNEILEYKNRPGRIIILYDEDERIATVSASTMVERGFDNIFILSGGLKVLGQKIPDGIVNGTYPPSCRIPAARKSQSVRFSGIPADLKKRRFSSEDLDKINHYMEESLVPQDTGSRLSRLTNNSRQPNSSKASMANSSFLESRRAWR